MKKLFFCCSTILTLLIADTHSFAQQPKRKISGQAKGAIIGGAGGAVAGGIIGKGVGGALIGGAIGAGGGYIIGNEHSKKVAREKREAAAEKRARQRAYYRTHHTVTHPSKNVTVIRKH